MCYMNSYNCAVECLNTDLNITALQSNVIEGLNSYSGCHITSCVMVVQDSTSPIIFDQSYIFPFIIIVLFSLVITYYLTKGWWPNN